MKKNVLTFGIIAGLIVTAMMVASSLACYYNLNFKGNEVLVYTGMLVAFPFIFIGVRNYRNKYSQGVITFGKAFKVGFFIALIASSYYTLVWLAEYYLFIPDFVDKYANHVMTQAKASGATEAQLAGKAKDLEFVYTMYKTPIGVIAATYMEVLPLGTIVALISALILRRRSGKLSGVLSN
ncbi:DUF4199 domain-containing protein [Chitinophaga pinensis]|uniref:DUF4199 domain-containing protein n=1 Tax=Chitinophaga pinensis (strain ATCC 43595 / DSM 2588 / LMG 13176 / NBRC 15968 / NCIMB 11800 / UQM 2034) TaxID=485918 RepID=A0A979G9B0_CHIPD|nr:DUF4199 domain-containing protein [Chitinophaga pinensis]ACU63195.1 conserved hypothetical protein [Chitinophaga pinensis DSM 2588]